MGYGLSKTWAMFLTFLLSACVHELVMVVVTQKFRYDILSFAFFEESYNRCVPVGCISSYFRYRLSCAVAFMPGTHNLT